MDIMTILKYADYVVLVSFERTLTAWHHIVRK